MSEDNIVAAGDARHQRREHLLQKLFACTFTPEKFALDYELSSGEFRELLDALPELDAQIKVVAPERPLSEINKIDLAILRLIMFESKHKKTPPKVLLNEAIELAKAFGSDGSSKFINGALARLLLE
ncbi:transcription antitermination protein NusB [Candidatus Woesebacteria bacterium]|nr:transcription antitermination protein NusB [Candidatus Woesebacteria bacterium]